MAFSNHECDPQCHQEANILCMLMISLKITKVVRWAYSILYIPLNKDIYARYYITN